MAARLVLKLPGSGSSSAPANAHGSGRPCGALSTPPSRAPPPAVARAVASSSPGAAENAASMQNLLGLPNGTAGQRDARETRTKKQLQKPEPKHPKNIHNQLSMVDALEKFGISRHYAAETKSILDATYSCWLQRDEEIMLDTETCAMAFRILRMSGYDVSSDDLSHIAEASSDLNSIRSLLELYKASQVSISEDELILDSIGTWSGRLLEEQLTSSASQRTPLLREVEHALSIPLYTTLDRLEHKRNIEQPDAMEHRMLHCLPWQMNQDLLALGFMDFTTSQLIYQQELELLKSWVKESRLDQLPFARMKLAYFYLSAAGTMFSPELSDARILWAMNGVLTTIVDDFFDVAGWKEELENLTALVEIWEKHEQTEYYSEQVEIVFCAIYSSVNQLGAKASMVQGRDVTGHLVQIWQDLLRNMMIEVEWRESGYVPTPEEYMENAVVTFALGPIVLPALYFVGPKIMESAITDAEYIELFRLMSTCGRLLNDVQTYEVYINNWPKFLCIFGIISSFVNSWRMVFVDLHCCRGSTPREN
uniref:Uncharacterized protein n=2 Tax=Avena sativa TaxID=4498 RepID=A0ACD5UV13_AVESA